MAFKSEPMLNKGLLSVTQVALRCAHRQINHFNCYRRATVTSAALENHDQELERPLGKECSGMFTTLHLQGMILKARSAKGWPRLMKTLAFWAITSFDSGLRRPTYQVRGGSPSLQLLQLWQPIHGLMRGGSNAGRHKCERGAARALWPGAISCCRAVRQRARCSTCFSCHGLSNLGQPASDAAYPPLPIAPPNPDQDFVQAESAQKNQNVTL